MPRFKVKVAEYGDYYRDGYLYVEADDAKEAIIEAEEAFDESPGKVTWGPTDTDSDRRTYKVVED